MKITVIVPIFKVENYLNKCIESITGQSYKDLEIILVDDGSPDNCPKMCDEWAKKDERIKVIHKENGGLSSARNAGLAVATGEYIYFCDSDDYLQLNALELLLKAIGDNDLIICGYNSISQGKLTEINYKNLESLTNEEAFNILVHQWFGTVWNKLYKKDLIKEYFNENCIWVEDLPFTTKYLKNVKKFTVIGDALYNYVRLREGAITTKIKEIPFEELKDVHEEMLKCLEEKGWTSSIAHQNASYLKSFINLFKPFAIRIMSKEDKVKIISYIDDEVTQKAIKNYKAINLKEKVFIYLLKKKKLKLITKMIKVMR